jgi:hypothetical protein
MTFGDRAEVRRARVGTKVLAFGFAIFAVLGSFWTIVWFIRSYVEPPRVTIAPAIALAARDTTPVAPAAPSKSAPPLDTVNPLIAPAMAETAPANPPAILAAPPDQPSTTSSIADRWMPLAPAPSSEPSVAPEPQPETTASVTTPAPAEPPAEEIAESSVPAISGPAPLPRRKPMQTAAVRARSAEPPLPRPRPDGPAPESIWTAVPSSDDRYQAGQ